MKVITIVGPTAVGKTSLAIALAERMGGEVVSADSRQVYRGLDIGTGKVTTEEMRGIPHHLIDVAEPAETFTAADYVRLGRAALEDIAHRGKMPIVVGGTGFYIDAFLGRMTLADVPPDNTLRARLAGMPLPELQDELRRLDPVRYESIDTKNPRRLMRAIEIAHTKPYPGPDMIYHISPYKVCWVGVTLPFPKLKERIHTRLLARMEAGMLDEARHLHEGGLSYERMDELGLEYRYLARHLKGELDESAMLAELEKEIVAYAKRQMTWFKKNKDITWFNPNEPEKITRFVLDSLGKGP